MQRQAKNALHILFHLIGFAEAPGGPQKKLYKYLNIFFLVPGQFAKFSLVCIEQKST